jgi:Uma2 family endonuclease
MLQQLCDRDLDQLYPSSDGKPMADNTLQYRWIVLIKENLEIICANRPDVFIAADLLWYPIQVKQPPAPSQAPDVMVIFGRPKGERRSYRQWQEENIPPQVVFEILSDSNKTAEGRREMQQKLAFYQQYGVEEYYIYDPDELNLTGWQRQQQQLIPIQQISDWISPRLQVRFIWQVGRELALYRPDGERFLSFLELEQRLVRERQRAEQERQRAEQQQQRAEQEQQRAEQERQRAEQQQQRAEQEQQRAQQQQQRAEQAEAALEEEYRQRQALLERLREMGIRPLAKVKIKSI